MIWELWGHFIPTIPNQIIYGKTNGRATLNKGRPSCFFQTRITIKFHELFINYSCFRRSSFSGHSRREASLPRRRELLRSLERSKGGDLNRKILALRSGMMTLVFIEKRRRPIITHSVNLTRRRLYNTPRFPLTTSNLRFPDACGGNLLFPLIAH